VSFRPFIGSGHPRQDPDPINHRYRSVSDPLLVQVIRD
jgi:hypothetical protein